MKREYFLITLFFLICAIFFYLFYQLIVPFFTPIAWAAVLTILANPLYEKLLPKVKNKVLASLIVCTTIVLIILGPLTYLLIAMTQEAAAAVGKLNELNKSGDLSSYLALDWAWLTNLREKVSTYYDVQLDVIARDSVDWLSSILLNQTKLVITTGAKAVAYFFLMVFTMYYFFKDGPNITGTLRRLMPLTPAQVTLTFNQLRDVIQATMYGGLAVAIIQGILGGLLFWAVGIPSVFFWGAIMAFMSILPIIGAFIIYLPAGIILMVSGSFLKGLLVIVIGSLVISQVDSVLRPYLIAGRAAMHPLMLFFSIMGGIAMFGLLGVVLGPMIAAIFMTLIRIFEYKLHPEFDPDVERETPAEA